MPKFWQLRPRQTWAALLLIGITVALRCSWISDMEFQADQANTSYLISHLAEYGLNPVAPIAGNSGVGHSMGFFHFVAWLSSWIPMAFSLMFPFRPPMSSDNPLTQALSIAIFNCVPIVLGLWFFRFKPVFFLAFAAIATSTALVLDSRKIWTPDLVPAWTTMSLFLFLAARTVKAQWLRYLLLVAASFSIVISGHMYLPGALLGGIATLVLSYWLWRYGSKKESIAWLAGSSLGWATFIPYFYSLFFHTCQVVECGRASRDFNITQGLYLLESFFFIPTSVAPFKHYLAKSMDQVWVKFPAGWIWVLLSSVLVGLMTWGPLYWVAMAQIYQRWKRVKEEPVLFLTVFLVCGTALALLVTRLAAIHLNYWLGALPFIYYTIAWTCLNVENPRLRGKLTQMAWIGVLSFASFSGVFLVLGHSH